MTLNGLLSGLRQKNINLWVEGDRLRYRGSEEAMTPELLEEIRRYKTEIIAYLREADVHARLALPPIRPAPRRTQKLPLSFAQEPLWFLHQLQPANASNHLYTGFHMRGPLDVAVLEKSLNEIIRRHEILRTTFATVDGQPIQVMSPSFALNIAEVDLQDFPEPQREAETQRYATEVAGLPFNLAQGPLFRAKLLRLGDEEYVLLLAMHHIVSDGWSFGVLYRELTMLYEAFSSGRPSPVADLLIQYGDFVLWQRQWMEEKTLEPQLSYWRERLGSSLPILELPTDRPRPAVQTFQGARRFIEFRKGLYEALKALSQREGCTLFMTLVAAFQTLLCRYTGQDDIIVGVPISFRNRPELEKLIGLFLNMVVLRTDLSSNPSFKEVLGRVREVTLGAYAHQDLPFEKLVEELRPERNLSRNPLFQVMLELFQLGKLEVPGLSISSLECDSGTAQFDLSAHLWEAPQGLTGHFEYNTDLFDSPTIDRMAEHFQTLLEGIVEHPDRRLSELPLLTEAECP